MLYGVKLVSIDSNAAEQNFENAHNIIVRCQGAMNKPAFVAIMGLRRAKCCGGEAYTCEDTLSMKESR